MSEFTEGWSELYDAQTDSIEVAILATVGDYAISKPAVISALDSDEIIVGGGESEAGGYSLQMLAADFIAAPPKGTPVSCNGSAAGEALEVLSTKNNNGILYLIVGAFAATE